MKALKKFLLSPFKFLNVLFALVPILALLLISFFFRAGTYPSFSETNAEYFYCVHHITETRTPEIGDDILFYNGTTRVLGRVVCLAGENVKDYGYGNGEWYYAKNNWPEDIAGENVQTAGTASLGGWEEYIDADEWNEIFGFEEKETGWIPEGYVCVITDTVSSRNYLTLLSISDIWGYLQPIG